MKEGWTYKTFGEVFDLQMGRTPDRKNPSLFGGDNIWVSIRDIDGKYIDGSKEHITNEAVVKSGIKLVKKGTVIMSFKLTVGKCAIARKDLYTNEAIMAFNVNKDFLLDSSFLYYYLQDYQWSGTNKAVMGLTLNKATISKQKIAIPPLAEQERIVAELDLLSSIIDKKKAQLKELDQLAQSIFYTMFGDPITNEKGWKVKKLGEIGTIVGGSTPSTNDDSNWDGTINWVTPAELGEQLYYGETIRKLTKMGARGLTMMPAGTVLLSSRAPIGKLAITTTPMCCNQGFKNIICDKIINNVFLYYYLKNTMDLVKALGRGATFKEVSKSAISSFKVILPPLPLQQEFASKVEAIERQKSLIQQSIVETQTLFDSRMEHWFN